VWDGTRWTAASAFEPPRRRAAALTYDLAHGRVVLFGGVDDTGADLGDTWQWDGAWRPIPFGEPQPRARHAMAYDARRTATVMFGGMAGDGHPLGDTWTWSGVDWQPIVTAAPPARADHAMAYDAARDRIVLFGGDLQCAPGESHDSCPGDCGDSVSSSVQR